MNNERKIAYQKRKIDTLESKLALLEQEYKTVVQENEYLHRVNDSNNQTLEFMKLEHKQTMQTLLDGIEESKKLRENYKAAIETALLAKKEYLDKMTALIKQIRK